MGVSLFLFLTARTITLPLGLAWFGIYGLGGFGVGGARGSFFFMMGLSFYPHMVVCGVVDVCGISLGTTTTTNADSAWLIDWELDLSS